MKVICLTNQKGGTGKTTLTALLGFELYNRKKKVLMVDLDPQAHLSSFFIKISELENFNGTFSLVRGEKFQIIELESDSEAKLSILPSRLRYVVEVFRGQFPLQDPFALDSAFRYFKDFKEYDFILVDTPPELYQPTIWGLYSADYIIIPINLEELSVIGAKIFIEDIFPIILSASRKDVRLLGLTLINISRNVSRERMEYLNRKIKNFIKKRIVEWIWSKIYATPLFETPIYKYYELKDLIYRPRRWEVPLFRIYMKNRDLRENLKKFVDEMLKRIEKFKSIGDEV